MTVTRLYYGAIKWFYSLELYEVAGLVAALVSIVIFLIYDKRLDKIFGVDTTRFNLVNDIYAIYQNPMSWIFTTIFLGLIILSRLPSVSPYWQRFSYIARIALTFLVMSAIYKIVNFYIAVFNPFDRDFVIAHIDRLLFFGKLPSQWIQPYVNPVFDAIFSVAYVSWFVLLYATALLMMKKSHDAVRYYLGTAMVTFYIGYTVYYFVPAIGPVFTVHYTTPIGALPHLLVMGQTILSRDCFPSLHTGISIVMAVSVWRYQRKWSWLYIPLTILIVLSTIYLRVHYFLDVVAGASLAIITTQLVPYVVEYWERTRQKVLLQHGLTIGAKSVPGHTWPDIAREWQ